MDPSLHIGMISSTLDQMSHPVPGPTRIADPNRVRGARCYVHAFKTLVDLSLIT